MALTKLQKEMLDRSIENKFDELVDNTYTLKELFEGLGITDFDFNGSSVLSAMKRVAKSKEYSVKKINVYRGDYTIYKVDYIFTNSYLVTKDKNILHFDCCNDLTYDFMTGEFSIPIFDDSNNIDNNWLRNSDYIISALKYEWLFNYCTDLQEIKKIVRTVPVAYYEKMPKDYIKNFGNTVTAETLLEAHFYAISNKYGRFLKGLYEDIYYQNDKEKVLKFIEEEVSIENLFKLIINDFLAGSVRFRSVNMVEFVNIYNAVKNAGLEYKIDTNRGLLYNFELLRKLKDEANNLLLENNLKRLNFIDGYESGEYIIKVPQTQAEKQEEGRMQNNCVGYFYDNSIIEGKNLIYFIRKKDSPNKSYITCRYHIESKDTIEYRYKNNNPVSKSKDMMIVKEVTAIINENL